MVQLIMSYQQWHYQCIQQHNRVQERYHNPIPFEALLELALGAVLGQEKRVEAGLGGPEGVTRARGAAAADWPMSYDA